MKDEYAGKVIRSFYGTGAKAYCVILGEKLDFYDNYLKPKFNNNINIIDSTNNHLILNINKHVLDTENHQSLREKLLENYNTNINIEIINISNNFLTLKVQDSLTKKAKGIKRCVIKHEITSEDYQTVVEKDTILFRKMNIFKSNLHNMYTQLKNKVALSPKDDERCILNGFTKTLAWGHYIISNSDNNLDNLVNIMDYYYINSNN